MQAMSRVLYYFLLLHILFPFIYPVIDKQFSPFVTFCSKHVEFNQDGTNNTENSKWQSADGIYLCAAGKCFEDR